MDKSWWLNLENATKFILTLQKLSAKKKRAKKPTKQEHIKNE